MATFTSAATARPMLLACRTTARIQPISRISSSRARSFHSSRNSVPFRPTTLSFLQPTTAIAAKSFISHDTVFQISSKRTILGLSSLFAKNPIAQKDATNVGSPAPTAATESLSSSTVAASVTQPESVSQESTVTDSISSQAAPETSSVANVTETASDAATDAATSAGIPSVSDAAFTLPDTQAVLTSIEHIGDLKLLGLCANTPVGLAQRLLEAIYVTTGLPWWATIAFTTVLIRMALFPIIVKIQRTAAVMHNLRPLTEPINEEAARLRKDGDMNGALRKSQELQEIFKKHNVSPFTMGLTLVQVPIFISFFIALRAMADLPVPGFAEGGFGWVQNLALADPYYILPIMASAGLVAVIELGSEMGASTAQSQGVKTMMRFVALTMVPFTASFPSAIFMYWVSTNIFTILQVSFLKSAGVRAWFRIPALNKTVKPPQGIGVVSKMGWGDAAKAVSEARKQVGTTAGNR
ncbi:Mitochondrial inner membrane protein oxa1l [Quaeritorhiza haematococci]|nr:Mitochondrial inner membrane protein oxa1l [Quaeritorhiza haematococci]